MLVLPEETLAASEAEQPALEAQLAEMAEVSLVEHQALEEPVRSVAASVAALVVLLDLVPVLVGLQLVERRRPCL